MHAMGCCTISLIPTRTLCTRFSILIAGALILVSCLSAHGQNDRKTKTTSSPAQSSPDDGDDRATQRWIPVDRRRLGELGRLGELLQNPPPDKDAIVDSDAAGGAPSKLSQSMPLDLSKVDLRTLEERLKGLTPKQRESLKKLASELSKNKDLKNLSSALPDLPDGLLDQMRESPTLREFAKDLLEDQQSDITSNSDDGISLEEGNDQPWIKFDPSNSSLKASDNSSSSKPTNDSAAAAGSQVSSTGKETNQERQGKGEIVPPTKSESDQSMRDNRTRSESLAAEQNGLNQGLQNRANQPNNIRNRQDPRSGNPATNTRSSRQSPNSQPARTKTNNPNQKSETAFESLRRRVRELGLGQTFEKLAKEAVGIEKSRDEGKESQSQQELAGKNRIASSKNQNNEARKELKTLDASSGPERQASDSSKTRSQDSDTRSEMDKPVSDRDAAAPFSGRSQKTSEQSSPDSTTEIADSKDSPSSWRVPTWNDLPSLSVWHLLAALVVILTLAGLLLVNRTPKLLQNVTQRRKAEAQRAQLLEMEIANREHVVLAFDTFVARQLRSFEDWWTSQRVVKHVVDRRLNYSVNLQAAEQVYKNARYSPPDQELTQDELTTVKEAIRECLKTRDVE